MAQPLLLLFDLQVQTKNKSGVLGAVGLVTIVRVLSCTARFLERKKTLEQPH